MQARRRRSRCSWLRRHGGEAQSESRKANEGAKLGPKALEVQGSKAKARKKKLTRRMSMCDKEQQQQEAVLLTGQSHRRRR